MSYIYIYIYIYKSLFPFIALIYMALKRIVFHFHFSTSLFHSCYFPTTGSTPCPVPIILSGQNPYKQPAQPNHIHTLITSINFEPHFSTLKMTVACSSETSVPKPLNLKNSTKKTSKALND